MKGNFEACLAVTLGFEGGLANNPKDPGGRTNRGITQKVYDAYRISQSLHPADVAGVGDTELQAIYRAQFWDAVKGEELSAGVDLAVFDYAVNSGASQAAKDLQRVLGAPVDGVVGSATLAGVVRLDDARIVEGVCDRRLHFMRGLRSWRDFGKGWTQRVGAVRSAALAMTGGTMHAVSAKASPGDQSKLRTPEGAGLSAAGVGAAGQTIMATAQSVQPHINDTWMGKIALLGFIIIGVVGGLLIGYSYFKRIKEAGGFDNFLSGLVRAGPGPGGGPSGG